MRLLKTLTVTTALAGLAFAGASHAGDCLDAFCTLRSLDTIDALRSGQEPAASDTDTSTVARHFGAWGIDLTGMDTSVRPGDDFFSYVNGTAVQNMVIPADKTSYGSFDLLDDLSQARSKAIITGLAAQSNLSGDDAKIAAIYNSMMDEAKVEQLDMTPMEPQLAAIAAISTKSQMAAYMGRSMGGPGSSFFGVGIDADAKNPAMNTLYMSGSGLNLPDRDYYLKDSFADKKAKYELYVADMLSKIGYPDAVRNAHDIVALETRIADVSWTRIQRRDATMTYNPMKLSEVPAFAPGFDWAAFFHGAGVSASHQVVLRDNTAMPKIAAIFADTPLDTLKAWEAFRLVDQSAPYLSHRFADTQWQFRSHDLSGTQEQRPRWKRAVGLVEREIGMSLGKDYVAQYFPASSKAKMIDLVAGLRAALKIRIQNLTWMSDDTKQKALAKLDKFGVKIGYPDKWRDFSGLHVRADDLYGNVQRSSAFEWAFSLSKLDKPVDKTEWGMTPQTVNAYYSPTRNEIVFPAAILQPPFFDPDADMAVNYGGIGGVIGHEITHGFDDQGRHYDGDGKLTDWWTADDSAKFDAQAKAYGAQYDTYEPVPGHHVQGGLTMGENIADLGGNLLGLDAYHLSLNGAASPVLDGFTGDQRVFMGFAQVWRSRYRDDALVVQVTSNPHSPPQYRVVGPTRNIDAWYAAFGVQPGEKYYIAPEDRVRIW